MPESDHNEVLRQLAIIRREQRRTRALLIFVSFAVAVLLFAPMWAAKLAEWASYLAGSVVPMAGLAVAVAPVLVLVSRYLPPRPVDYPPTPERPTA